MFFNCVKVTAKCLQRVNNQLHGRYITPVMQIQKYSDWYHRQPVKIVNEEEILQYAEEATGPNEFIDKEPVKYKNEKRMPLKVRPKPKQIKKKLEVTPDDSKLHDDGSLNFIELKDNDRILNTLMMSVRSRKTRDKNSRIILEGRRLIIDAINSGATPEIIVFSRQADVLKLPLPDKGVKLFKTTYSTIQTWSTLVTTPGLMGFFQIPDVEQKEPAPDALPLTIICDNVRDPGNLGSILRAAAAVGCKKLITLVGCVDIWESKVLKSAAGCHFRMPIFASKTWDEIPQLIDSYANIFIADNSTLSVTDSNSKEEESSKSPENEDTICESNTMNDDDELSEDEVELDGDVDGLKQVTEKKSNTRKTEYQRVVECKIAKQITSNVPVIPYYGANYTDNENVIIIGGETLGLSLQALDMVKEKYGIRINIPMTNGVDSLNTGTALGIIAFEIKRQYAVKQVKKEE